MEKAYTILTFGKEVLTAESKALASASQSLDDRFKNAVDYLIPARKVIVAGIGKSGIIARKIAATFSSVGTPGIFLHPVEALHGDIGILDSNDVCILLSKSGTTSEILQLIPYIKQKNIPIISIVGMMNSAIARLSDIALSATIEKEACPLNLAPTASTSVMMGLGDALALAVMKLKNFTTEDFAGNHPAGQLGRNLNYRVQDVMHKGDEIPAVGVNSSFREALIESSAKALGCVCVIENNYLLGIITDGDIRRILQQYEDIRSLTVKQVMKTNPQTIHENSLLGEAVALMEHRERQISVLPVVNSLQQCVGVLRIHDILRSEG